MAVVSIHPPKRSVDPQFYAGMQVICSAKKLPLKVAQETLIWMRTVAFVSKEQLDHVAGFTEHLKTVGKVYTRVSIIPDVFFLIEAAVKLPEQLSVGYSILGNETLGTFSKIKTCSEKIFLDTVGPLFQTTGFFISDLLSIELIDLGQYLELFKLSFSSLLLVMSVKDVTRCYFKYNTARTEQETRTAILHLIEKGSTFALNALYFTSLGSAPTLAVTLLLLSTTKLLSKIANEYVKQTSRATLSHADPQLGLDTKFIA